MIIKINMNTETLETSFTVAPKQGEIVENNDVINAMLYSIGTHIMTCSDNKEQAKWALNTCKDFLEDYIETCFDDYKNNDPKRKFTIIK